MTHLPAADSAAALRMLRDELHALFRDLDPGRSRFGGAEGPAVDVVEIDTRVEIRIDLMGVSPDELVVEVEGDMLRLRGARRLEVEEQTRGDRWAERQKRRFLRGIQLPSVLRPETMEARYEHGLLTITFEARRPRSPLEATRPKIRRT